MNLPTRHMLIGMTLGAVCATALAAIGPGMVIDVIADERPVGIDSASLVRFPDQDHKVEVEDWVDTKPITTTRVKKIEAGRVEWVDITTTSTGTYSTDALLSDHVQYPGFEVTRATHRQPNNQFSSWDGKNWLPFNADQALSMIFADAATALQMSGNSTCIYGSNYRVC